MTERVDISIITPVFNTPNAYLKEYWKSIMELRGRLLFEVIIVDDGSTSAEITEWINEHQSFEFVRIIRFNHNRGISAARNAAIDIARGEYFLILDSDDYIHDVAALVEMYLKSKDTSCDMCIAPFQYDRQGEIYDEEIKYKGKRALYELESLSTCSRLIRLELVHVYGIAYPEGKYLEDPCFNLMLLMCTKRIEFYENSFLTIRDHALSTSKQRSVFRAMNKDQIPLECIEKKLFDFSKILNKGLSDVHKGALINLLASICCIFVNDADRKEVAAFSAKLLRRIDRPIYISIKYLLYGKSRKTMKVIQLFFVFFAMIRCEYAFARMVHFGLMLNK